MTHYLVCVFHHQTLLKRVFFTFKELTQKNQKTTKKQTTHTAKKETQNQEKENAPKTQQNPRKGRQHPNRSNKTKQTNSTLASELRKSSCWAMFLICWVKDDSSSSRSAGWPPKQTHSSKTGRESSKESRRNDPIYPMSPFLKHKSKSKQRELGFAAFQLEAVPKTIRASHTKTLLNTLGRNKPSIGLSKKKNSASTYISTIQLSKRVHSA